MKKYKFDGDIVNEQNILPGTSKEYVDKTFPKRTQSSVVGTRSGDEAESGWQDCSKTFLHSYPRRKYKHLMVCGVDSLESTAHAVKNLLHLASGRGLVTPMKEIAKNSSKYKQIAIAKFRKATGFLIRSSRGSELELSFDEFYLTDKNFDEFHLSSRFNAFFFSELAEELQNALDVGLLRPGALVAICNPQFQKYTAAPVSIRFQAGKDINLIVLTCTNDNIKSNIISNKTKSHIKGNPNSSTNIQLCVVESTEDRFKIFSVNSPLNKVEAVSGVLLHLGKPNVTSLHDFFEKNKTDSINVLWDNSSRTIISYFLKVVLSLESEGHCFKAVLFCREIHPSGELGYFFKVALHKHLAKLFHAAFLSKGVVQGDIVAFLNPTVFSNPEYISKDLLSEEPYFVQSGIDAAEKVYVYNLVDSVSSKQLRITEILNTETATQSCGLSESIESRKKRARVASPEKEELIQTTCTKINKPTTIYSSVIAEPVLNSLKKLSVKENIPKLRSKDDVSKSAEESDVNEMVFPISLERPSLKSLDHNELDLVSGYCFRSCCKMIIYHDILWSKSREPLCPMCLDGLRLMLCFELRAVLLSQDIIFTVFAAEQAEKFLDISCIDFLNHSEVRRCAIKVLISKCATGNKGEKALGLKFSEITDWRTLKKNQ